MGALKKIWSVWLLLWLLAASSNGFSTELPKFASQAEADAVQKLSERFASGPEIKPPARDKTITLQWRGLKEAKSDFSSLAITMDGTQGQERSVTSNAAMFSNDDYKQFAAFQHLRSLTLWHNSHHPLKKLPEKDFDGSGVAHLLNLPDFQAINLSGGQLNDAGMAQIAKLPTLKSFSAWHSSYTETGLAMLLGNKTLEEIALGPFWDPKATDKTMEYLSQCPKLRKIKTMESWYTYEHGLKHLKKLEGVLKELDLGNSLLEPADVERLKKDLPETKVNWQGNAEGGKMLKGSGWHLGKAKKWIPESLLQKALESAR